MSPQLNIQGQTHDHIDGSEPVIDIYPQLCDMNGIPPEKRMTPEQIVAYFDDVHHDLVNKFSFSTKLLQTPDTLELMGYAYGKHRALAGYLYVEAQFAPQYHCEQGLSMGMVTHHMLKGLERAEREFGIRIFPVLDIGREIWNDPEKRGYGEALARIALKYGGRVGLGLACVEPGNPPEKHIDAFRLTFGTDVPRIIHAGEWVEPEPAATYRQRLLRNIRTAIVELQANDVGHAIALCDDHDLIGLVAATGVRISMCPLSNKTLGAIKDVRELGIDRLLDAGVCVTINADDDLFLPGMHKVVDECQAAYGFSAAQMRALEDNALKPSLGCGPR